ncbi:MAG TPA: hypothetical protein PK995_08795 [Bacteroidia bacterium]|nr:hypothetical protein [Bacteroidia bacterium]
MKTKFISYCLFLGSLFIEIINNYVKAQCCSANPVVGSTNIGLLSKNTLREIAFYRYTYSDTYFENDNKREDIHYLRYSLYSYFGNILSYGISSKFTIDLELGYYLKKVEKTDAGRILSTNGLNNGVVSLKYGLFKTSTFECTIGSGLKFPFSSDVKKIDGRPASVSLQPSTNAFGGVFLLFLSKNFPENKFRMFLIHRAELLNAYNSMYYMRGNTFFTTLFLSKSISESWSILLQIRNEYRTRDYWYDIPQKGTGGLLFFISPQINYNFKGFNLSIVYDVPVYRNVNERQIVSKYAFSFICTKDFNL